MPVRAVFFDLGGTLMVMRRDRVFQAALADLGLKSDTDTIHRAYMGLEGWWISAFASSQMTPDETTRAYRQLDQKVFAALYPGSSEEDAKKASSLAGKKWAEVDGTVPLELYPDAEPTLKALSERRYHLGLISNAPADTAKTVALLGLDRHLKTIVISGAVGYSKPRKEIFEIAMREAGFGATESVHVGDLFEADIVGAKNAGMKGILIDRTGGNPRQDCVQVSSLADVQGHL